MLLLAMATSAAAQEDETRAAFVLPESPNSTPMESVWDYAPEARAAISPGPGLIWYRAGAIS
ncbi:MAG: hypothetical protein R3E50_07090 [Halioglobus sp.]